MHEPCRHDEMLSRRFGRLGLVFAAVLLLGIAPMAGLLWHVAATGRADQKREAQARLLQAARFAVGAQTATLEAVSLTLGQHAAAVIAHAGTEASCTAWLRDVVARDPLLSSMILARRDGALLCGSLGPVGGASIAARPYFRAALAGSGLAVGAPVAMRGVSRMKLPVAIALPGAAAGGADQPAVLAATLDLERVARLLAGTQNLRGDGSGGKVLVLDMQGRMLAQYPPQDGAAPSPHPFIAALLSAPEGMLELTGSDGTPRLVGFAHATEGDVIYAVSILSDSVTEPADARFRGVLALAVLASAIGLVLAFLLAHWRVLRPVALLTEAAGRVQSTGANAIPTTRLPAEFDVLRRAMAAMVDAVAHREEHLRQANDGLAQANRDLERLAARDALTGLANRRAFDAALAEVWRRSAREGASLALAVLDVDFFKKFNDRYGHLHGDECLRKVAKAISAVPLREADLPARLGGEEFVLLLPGTDAAGAMVVAERALEAIRARMILHEDHPAGIVTASIGVAACRPIAGMDAAALIKAADAALYRAKETGRDRVASAGEAAEAPHARAA